MSDPRVHESYEEVSVDYLKDIRDQLIKLNQIMEKVMDRLRSIDNNTQTG